MRKAKREKVAIRFPASYYLDAILEDNSSAWGGVSFKGETLKHFLDEEEIDYDTPMYQVNRILEECGIKSIKKF